MVTNWFVLATYLGADAEGDGHSEKSRGGRSGRSSRSRRKDRGREKERGGNKGHGDQDKGRSTRDKSRETEKKAGFEPVLRPEPYHPQLSSGPVNAYSSPEVAMQQGMGMPSSAPVSGFPGGQMTGPGMMAPGSLAPGSTSGPFVGVQGQPMGAPGAVPGMGPHGQLQGQPGYPQPGVPHQSILKHPGIQPTSGPPGSAPQGYAIPPGYTIPPPPGSQSTGGPGYGAATQTAAHGASQTFEPLPTHPMGPSVALGQTPGVQPGGSAFTAPAQALAYNSGRVFLPAYPTSPSKPTGRVYYSKGSGGGGGGGGGDGGPPFSQGAGYYRDRSPEHNVRFLPAEPLAQGTPIAGHTMPRTGGSNTNMPSPIRK